MNFRSFTTCIILFVVVFSSIGRSQTISVANATNTSGDNGKITISNGGYTNGTSYVVSYSLVTSSGALPSPTLNIPADAQGTITISNLVLGTYSGITVNGVLIPRATTYTINRANIAKNTWQAFAAYYTNFSGLVDDNSSSFNQVHARASLPLAEPGGIGYNASLRDRIIWFRNLFLQAEYSTNVTNLPAFYDSTNLSLNPGNPVRYVNRLDLLKHEKEGFNINFNLLTFVVPEHGHSGDLGHIYLDFTSGVFGTNVSDSTFGSTFFAKSYKWGLNLKYRAENIEVADHNLGFELSAELLKIGALDNNFNPNLNPQLNDRTEKMMLNSLNTNKPLIASSQTYIHPDLLIYYYTGTTGDSVSSSNVFLHLSFYSNFASANSNNFANNYFQVQIGYAMSIKKLLSRN